MHEMLVSFWNRLITPIKQMGVDYFFLILLPMILWLGTNTGFGKWA